MVPEAIRYLGIVFGVSAVLATLFTAWTPASFQAVDIAALFGQPDPEELSVSSVDEGVTQTPGQLDQKIGIVIGHAGPNPETGLVDPGATCQDGMTELQINQKIAGLVVRGLEAADIEVDLLEEFDQKLVEYRATALVSIHADACYWIDENATGYKVAAAIDSVIPDLSQRLVTCIADRYGRATGLQFHPGSITRDMTAYHTFYEIHNKTPAVIIETGFLYLDRKFLTENPEMAARGIIDGIFCYIHNEPASLDWSAEP
jgi:N-acetylmuramoyl-L-alanine amidase